MPDTVKQVLIEVPDGSVYTGAQRAAAGLGPPPQKACSAANGAAASVNSQLKRTTLTDRGMGALDRQRRTTQGIRVLVHVL